MKSKYHIDYESLDQEWTAIFADNFKDALANFIEHLPHDTDLPAKTNMPLSEMLRAFIGDKYTCKNFDIWHKYITKPMFDQGWAMLYLPTIMQITTHAGAFELRMENLKWVLTNWNWITAIYEPESFYDFATIYSELGNLVKSDFPEENPLREKLLKMLKTERNKLHE